MSLLKLTKEIQRINRDIRLHYYRYGSSLHVMAVKDALLEHHGVCSDVGLNEQAIHLINAPRMASQQLTGFHRSGLLFIREGLLITVIDIKANTCKYFSALITDDQDMYDNYLIYSLGGKF